MDSTLRLACLILAASLGFGAPAKAGVAYAGYDLAEHAVTLGNVRYRLFRLSTASAADLSVTVHSTGFDPVLVLAPSGGRAVFNDDAQGTDAAISVPQAAPGDWYLAVGALGPATEGAFTIAFSPADAALSELSDDAALAGLTALVVRRAGRSAEAPPLAEAATGRDGFGEASYAGANRYLRLDDLRGWSSAPPPTPETVTAAVPADLPPRPRAPAAVPPATPAAAPPPTPATLPAPLPAVVAAVPRPTELPPLLPWPPPEPSARIEVRRTRFLGADGGTTLGDVDDRLRAALSANGYDEVGYFGVPEGFALVTRLERFEPGGASIVGPSRWTLEVPPLANFDLYAYVKALFTAQTGHFRVIAFVVTSAPFAAGEAGAEAETLQRWTRTGDNALPLAVRAWPFGDGHAVTALVYEFSKVRGGRNVNLDVPSETSAMDHLTASRILAALGG